MMSRVVFFSMVSWLLVKGSFGGFSQALGQDFSINLSQSGNQVVFSWDSVPGATGYRVEYREEVNGGEWAAVEPSTQWPVTSTQWTAPLSSMGQRFFRVVALINGMTLQRGQIVESNLIKIFTTQEIAALFSDVPDLPIPIPIVPELEVSFYQVLYQTIDPQGFPTVASGAVLLPFNSPGSYPILSYQHGTIVEKMDVPSLGNGLEFLIGLAGGTTGYATALPDYLGLGLSEGLHPYVHAKSEATAVVDLLRATRVLAESESVALNGKLFLFGYSQGGHATMAAHREIEAFHGEEFQVTASSPMAGPHDISGVMTDLMLGASPVDAPYYLPYTLLAYNEVYGFLVDLSVAIKEPYVTSLPPLFDGTHSSGEIDDVMPSVAREIMQPDFLADFLADSRHPFREALKDNDLYDWTPQAPIRMYHCDGDTTVPDSNSKKALNTIRANGWNQIELMDPWPFPFGAGDHSSCVPFALLSAKDWFDSLK